MCLTDLLGGEQVVHGSRGPFLLRSKKKKMMKASEMNLVSVVQLVSRLPLPLILFLFHYPFQIVESSFSSITSGGPRGLLHGVTQTFSPVGSEP